MNDCTPWIVDALLLFLAVSLVWLLIWCIAGWFVIPKLPPRGGGFRTTNEPPTSIEEWRKAS